MQPEKKITQLNKALYGKNLNVKQCEVIKYAIDCGLDEREVQVLTDEKLSCDQMLQGLYGFMCGLSIKDVESYMHAENSVDAMKHMRFTFLKPEERKIKSIIQSEVFNAKQLLELRKGSNLPLKHIELYSSPCFTAEQMEQIRIGFEQGISYDLMCYLADPRFTVNQMRFLRLLAELGVSHNVMIEVAHPDIPEESMYNLIRKVKRQRKKDEKEKNLMYNLSM